MKRIAYLKQGKTPPAIIPCDNHDVMEVKILNEIRIFPRDGCDEGDFEHEPRLSNPTENDPVLEAYHSWLRSSKGANSSNKHSREAEDERKADDEEKRDDNVKKFEVQMEPFKDKEAPFEEFFNHFSAVRRQLMALNTKRQNQLNVPLIEKMTYPSVNHGSFLASQVQMGREESVFKFARVKMELGETNVLLYVTILVLSSAHLIF
ncbi:hypothetical protein C2845_PM12G02360 [Panicum miliaceum]|uniref:Uncharacterized protein n=1 Tax=Panicum miliaceum TaxID=4540 RepID=A0A3L6QHF7_PANMI|nr:hypothetical protein C2845_PM12G02360 [Panicum miliaceum]